MTGRIRLEIAILAKDPARSIARLVEVPDRIRDLCPGLVAVRVAACLAVLGTLTG